MVIEQSKLLDMVDQAIWEYINKTRVRNRDEMILLVSPDAFGEIMRDCTHTDAVGLLLFDNKGAKTLFGVELKVSDSMPEGKVFHITDKASYSNEAVQQWAISARLTKPEYVALQLWLEYLEERKRSCGVEQIEPREAGEAMERAFRMASI